jgi:hypothetical protein
MKIVTNEDSQKVDFVVSSMPDEVLVESPSNLLLLCILQEMRIMNRRLEDLEMKFEGKENQDDRRKNRRNS